MLESNSVRLILPSWAFRSSGLGCLLASLSASADELTLEAYLESVKLDIRVSVT